MTPSSMRSLILERSMPVPGIACRMWLAGYSGVGYGYVWLPDEKRMVSAPRVAFLAWNGELGPGEVPRHTCDWRPCVNYEHLIRGTHADNARDRCVRNRSARRLHPMEIIDIRKRAAAGETHRGIGKIFGVTRQAIDQIINRITWSHVE